jgi:hypothetical protein
LNLRVAFHHRIMDFYQLTLVAVVMALAIGLWALVKTLLRTIPPFRLTPTAGEPAMLDGKYRSDWRRGRAEGLIAWLGATVVFAIALWSLSSSLAPEAGTRLAPGLLAWLVPGALLAWPVGHAWWNHRRARLLGERQPEVLELHEQHQRLRERPLRQLKSSAAATAGVVSALLLADWYLQAAPDGLTWDPLWSLQKHAYSYADVDAVESLQSRRSWHGDITREPSYRVRLTDGRVWESWRAAHGMTRAELDQAMQLVAQRAKRPLQTLDPYPRGLPVGAPRTGRNTATSS